MVSILWVSGCFLGPATSWCAQREFSIQWDRFGSSRFPDLDGLVSVQKGEVGFGDLTPSEFRLYEDGVEQSSLSVVPETGGVDVALVVDSSGSMREALSKSLGAVRLFLKNLKQSDRAALVDFDDLPRVLCPLTNDGLRMGAALERPKADGGTALYDALGVAAGLFPADGRRRVVVLLTDGNDQNAMGSGPGSRITFKAALERCLSANLSVYVIGLGFQVDRKLLRTLSDRTGGQAYWAADAGDLKDLYLQIGRDIERRYRISYRTSNPFRDGSTRRVRIQVRHAGWFGESSTVYSVAGDGVLEGAVRRPSVPVIRPMAAPPPLPTLEIPTITPTPSPTFAAPTVTPTPKPVRARTKWEATWNQQVLFSSEWSILSVRSEDGLLDARRCLLETWPDRLPPEGAYYMGNQVALKPGNYRVRHKGRVWISAVVEVVAGEEKTAILR